MAVYCGKCGKEVDTLAKRRHRCRKGPATESAETHVQLIWWSYLAQSKFDHVGEGNSD